ncbi:hypothetical protein Tco_0840171 [Tanacetum coccineum]|uniref:Uncharacterized protein n=1 Tax=Tanacetum coccineum TaxID=301880 RepID=A0ABQ5AXJ3_9ASTR
MVRSGPCQSGPVRSEEHEEEEEVHAEQHIETKDTSAPQPPSPKTVRIQDLSTKILLLQSHNLKLEKEKANAEAEVAFFSAQPSYPNVEQLTELLQLSTPTELKELLSKFQDISGEIKDLKKYVEGLEIKIPGDLKVLPGKLEEFQSSITSLTTQVANIKNLQLELPAEFLALPGKVSSIQVQLSKLKTLDALPNLLNRVTEALDRFAQAIENASTKTGGHSVLLAGQACTHPAEGEKNTQQVTISQLFQRKAAKDDAKANLNTQPIPTTSPITTTVIPPVTTTVQFQSPFLSSPPQERQGQACSMVESSKKKYLKKFDFVTKKGDHVHYVHLTKEQIKEQKRIEESVKADLAKKKKKREKKRKGSHYTEGYWDDGSNEIIPNFKASDLNLSEWREIDFNKPLGEQDPIIKLNDLARKKRKHADDIHDYFRSTKKYKSSVQYKDHLAGTVLKEPTLVSASVLQVLRSSGIFTSVYVAVQILKKALARALIQLGWQFQAERCFENRPSMLKKGMYDSWKTRIMLYIKGKENGDMLLDSIKNGTSKLEKEITIKYIDGFTDIKTPDDLAPKERLRYDSDIKAVNLILLGLPVDIYTLINHYQTTKEI